MALNKLGFIISYPSIRPCTALQPILGPGLPPMAPPFFCNLLRVITAEICKRQTTFGDSLFHVELRKSEHVFRVWYRVRHRHRHMMRSLVTYNDQEIILFTADPRRQVLECKCSTWRRRRNPQPRKCYERINWGDGRTDETKLSATNT
jgi:hypothetical protein